MIRDYIGARVKTQRKAKGLTRAELAGVTEYSDSAIKFLEMGKRNPSADFFVPNWKSVRCTNSIFSCRWG